MEPSPHILEPACHLDPNYCYSHYIFQEMKERERSYHPYFSPNEGLENDTILNKSNLYLLKNSIDITPSFKSGENVANIFPDFKAINNSQNEMTNLKNNRQMRFKLSTEPFFNQRKSYKSESRLLTPNPFVIREIEFGKEPDIMQGFVTVHLLGNVGGGGEDVMVEVDNCLKSMNGNCHNLDLTNEAKFSLSISNTYVRGPYKLCFEVEYIVLGIGSCIEKIYSDEFVCSSHSKMTLNKRRPILTDVLTKTGFANEKTQIWIRGDYFSTNTTVFFGDYEAEIKETNRHLMVVDTPMRLDLRKDEEVKIKVVNTFSKTRSHPEHMIKYPSHNTIPFSYIFKEEKTRE